jgi:hypothetical protein
MLNKAKNLKIGRLVLCLKNDSFPKKVRYGTVWYCLVLFGTVWYLLRQQFERITVLIIEDVLSILFSF